ncbi:stage II sporulation protein P [Pullulanibacillus sp. KACC 23026]|uniref:stage II sporulation protein P n=1 Tax=Pullulanibacillus sp. KACC 23026 TaxID=3028315 RepID=UPI0023AEA63C|nr:stage II sporulation protein P [Pullulanibacillus sp. KACC 23026]WEG10848.1 stage II sporulation protein P [Pullulanibacillus sp. KACC 23026]
MPIKQRELSTRSLIWQIPVTVISLFILIGVMTTPLFQRFFYLDFVDQALHSVKAEPLVELMGAENPVFDHALPKNYETFHFSKFALQTVTHINLEDERSLLGNELPGFALYDTHIVVAGEGTNYTNVPNDTPPSLDYILKQQQQDFNQNSSDTDSNGQSSHKPSTTNVKGAQILLYSTHSWENYLPLIGKTGDPVADDAVGSGSKLQGVHLVDTWLKNDLESEGIGTDVNYQDAATVLHEHNWNTNQAYTASRSIVEDAVKSGKPYKLIIDIHRDSARENVTTAQINNKRYARVDLVIGTADPHYQQNEAIAQKLNDAMNKEYPGLSRGIFAKGLSEGNGVYNQDLSTHALLFEIGGVDNNETELKNTDAALAKIISEYVKSGS